MDEKQLIKGNRKARRLALQALYQWFMAGTDLYAIEAEFHTMNNMEKVNVAYFHRLLHGVPAQLDSLQMSFMPFMDREIDSLTPIELTVLRIGAFELLHCPELPFEVVLDESVSLAKEFGSQDGFRYVNGVLNNLARQVRTVEMSGRKQQ